MKTKQPAPARTSPREAKRHRSPLVPGRAAAASAAPPWTFLTNYAHVLLCIAQEPEMRMRDVAARVGITERALQRIVADLEQHGYLERTSAGRRNRYEIQDHLPLRHPVEQHVRVSALIALVLGVRKR